MHTDLRINDSKYNQLPKLCDCVALTRTGINRSTFVSALGFLFFTGLIFWSPSGPLWGNNLDNEVITGPGMPVRYLFSHKVHGGFPDEFENGYSAHHVGSNSELAPIEATNALKVEGHSSGAWMRETIGLTEDSYSFAVWFRPDHLPGQNGTAVDFPILSNPSNLKIRLNQNGKFYASFHQQGPAGVILVEVESPQYDQWEQWYHLCKVVDYGAQTMTFYVNGQDVGSAPFDSMIPPEDVSNESWSIGYSSATGTNTWSPGYFWDARMYDEALSPVQVETIFATSPIDTDADGLPDWWEIEWFGDLTSYSGSDPSPGDPSITVLQAYLEGRNPHVASVDDSVLGGLAVSLEVFTRLYP